MTKFKVGDKVRVLDAGVISIGFISYDDGMTTEVTVVSDSGSVKLRDRNGDEDGVIIYPCELHAIELIDESSERISELESDVSSLKEQVAELRKEVAEAKREARNPVFVGTPQKAITNNERRAKVIAKAKAFVEETKRKMRDCFEVGEGNKTFRSKVTIVEFHVNTEKRVVTALVKGRLSRKLYEKGIAKCAPDDVFNADVGKAISLARALGIEVPAEFIDAVKPSEPVVGMRVNGAHDATNYYTKNKTFTLTKKYLEEGDAYRYEERTTDWIYRRDIGGIIDDTNAEYPEVSTQEVSA